MTASAIQLRDFIEQLRSGVPNLHPAQTFSLARRSLIAVAFQGKTDGTAAAAIPLSALCPRPSSRLLSFVATCDDLILSVIAGRGARRYTR
jgi:hypothetical protein